MATKKVIGNYSQKDNKTYAKYLRTSCGVQARAKRSDAGKKRK